MKRHAGKNFPPFTESSELQMKPLAATALLEFAEA